MIKCDNVVLRKGHGGGVGQVVLTGSLNLLNLTETPEIISLVAKCTSAVSCLQFCFFIFWVITLPLLT